MRFHLPSTFISYYESDFFIACNFLLKMFSYHRKPSLIAFPFSWIIGHDAAHTNDAIQKV